MTIDPTCIHLVLDRPAKASVSHWVDAWTAACCRRLVPDLRAFSIGRDQCRLSIERRDGVAENGLSVSLDAVAAILASCDTTAPAPVL